jgi:hypothetical protein
MWKQVLLLSLACSSEALAQYGVVGAEPLEVARTSERTCVVYPDYLVVESRYQSALGEAVSVFRRDPAAPGAPCDSVGRRALLSVGEPDDARYFFGMLGPYVLIDSGTGPEERGLEVYDAETGALVYRGSYWSHDDVEALGPDRIAFFKSLWGDQRGRTCPEAQTEGWSDLGLGFWFEERVMLDLATGELERTGEVKCSPRM